MYKIKFADNITYIFVLHLQRKEEGCAPTKPVKMYIYVTTNRVNKSDIFLSNKKSYILFDNVEFTISTQFD